MIGAYQTGKVILGEGAGTSAMPQPYQPGGLPIPVSELPERVQFGESPLIVKEK